MEHDIVSLEKLARADDFTITTLVLSKLYEQLDAEERANLIMELLGRLTDTGLDELMAAVNDWRRGLNSAIKNRELMRVGKAMGLADGLDV